LLIEDPGQLDELVRMAIRIGLDHIAGYALVGDVLAALELSGAIGSIPRHHTSELHALIEADPYMAVVDVRGATEHRENRVAGADNIAHTRIPARLGELPSGKMAIHCGSGVRAASAASYLAHLGHEVAHVDGGYGEIPEKLRRQDDDDESDI
jgi:hydroxyacylglutathione hydrolase